MASPRVPEESTKLSSNTPISLSKLSDICTEACSETIPPDTVYDHSRTSSWNEQIIHAVLKSLIGACSTHKFIVYTTIIQRDVTALSRGIHSTSGAYWNNDKDGMYNFSWNGGDKDRGLDIVLSIAWISRE
ncbi:Tctex-1 [Lipomyces tetrasporus]|uniref:Topoisomerase I damage affected protein 2 n=1 Tax=Lipomyces tetrasporus TaxID=54092 RepID=A0AAD7QQC9_9ASCO|nr:Tctex-1 [Lipomyces tetrasporus]KAJ8099051.1 Tctex-1 [Lipomyces tetrasporus]